MENFEDFKVKKTIRMCIGCRQRFLQAELIRLKFDHDNLAFFNGFGRSFYLCESCIDKEKIFQSILKMKNAPKNKEKIQFGIQEIRKTCHQK